MEVEGSKNRRKRREREVVKRQDWIKDPIESDMETFNFVSLNLVMVYVSQKYSMRNLK